MSKKKLLITSAVCVVLITAVIIRVFYRKNLKTDSEKQTSQFVSFKTQQSNVQPNLQNRSSVEINTAKRMKYRNRFDKYITVYVDTSTETGPLIFISNKTEYNLDQVVVRVDYLNEEDKVDTSASIQFSNVQPGLVKAEQTLLIETGKHRLKCVLERISSAALNFCYPSNNGSPEDQFFCTSQN